MTPSLLSDLRAALESKRAELRGPKREDIEITKWADPIDQSQADQLREQADGEANRVDGHLKAINEALARMKAGEYGICEECGEEIPEKRLRAVPWARRCVACQEEMEKR
ncbi:MAG: TraR/DksA family transcriptional regulator [Acidobacteriales bacterium]|nr:TraR/DksA family transcriptional regulator [Terriglobales bacterium]